jgi:hypothetical protein
MIDIPDRLDKYKESQIKIYPCHTNRASSMGHPCLRYLVYCRLNWADALPHDVGLQYVFDEGRHQEEDALDDLARAGIRLIEQQRPFEWKDYQITGHIDGKVLDEGQVYPAEIKSVEPNAWAQILTIEDMLESKKFWWRKCPAQMYLYLLMDNKEIGLFLMKNKVSGRFHQIETLLDFDYAEGLLKKAEAINRHVAESTYPEPMKPDEQVCNRCGFLHLCYPDRDFGAALEVLENEELLENLEDRDRLMAAYKDYKEVDSKVKKVIKGKANAIIGNYRITGDWVIPKGRPKYWKSTILKLN